MGTKVKITRSQEEHETYGKVSKLEFPNKSKLLISNRGWNIVLPKTKYHMDLIEEKNNIEINLSFAEINMALEESIEQGYTNSRKDGGTQ